jgi:quercetin dioxygenase-like cupin family protein
MRRFRVEDATRTVGAFESVGFHLSPLAKMSGDSQVVWVELDAGGEIARHAASGHQLLVVVRGQGEVSGETGVYESVAAGDTHHERPCGGHRRG